MGKYVAEDPKPKPEAVRVTVKQPISDPGLDSEDEPKDEGRNSKKVKFGAIMSYEA